MAGPPVFIVGVQRSGTTLLRLILNSHSTIAIPEEARFLTPLLSKRVAARPIRGGGLNRLINYLRENDQFRLWNYDRSAFFSHLESCDEISLKELIEAMYNSYADSEGKSRWADKSLFFDSVGLLSSLFPEAQFIHVVRDGRGVFSSWRTMDPSKNHPTSMALDWTYKLYRIERALANVPPEKAKVVRYEDLISRPEETVRDICEFIGAEFEPAMMGFHETSSRYIGDHHSELIFKPIDDSNMAKWKRKLTRKEVDAFTIFGSRGLRKYGYEVPEPAMSPGLLIFALTDLLIGLPHRALQVLSARWDYFRALSKGRATKSVPVGVPPKERNAGAEQD